jgi:tellurite resistance protein TehA-like permease
MGTGIVSLDLSVDHHETLFRILLAIAAAAWAGLALLLAGRALADPARVASEARMPAALSGVAATAVLGSGVERLSWNWAAVALLVVAFGLWLALLLPVLAHLRTPAAGAALLLTVAPASLAVLSSTLAVREHTDALLYGAVVALVLGLAFYVFVLARFDYSQLIAAGGDHWITGGALAISTLAAAQIALDARSMHALGSLLGALKTASVVLWALSIAWLVALLLSEIARPRLGYDLLRWATVFPVGMYAACSFAVGTLANARAITDFARVWVWLTLALWLVVLVATVRSAVVVPGRRLHRAS